MDSTAKQAIEALKLIPQCGCHPEPWTSGPTMVLGANGRTVALATEHNRDKITAAVNAAPHLLAALEAARVAVGSVRVWHQTGCDAESLYCKAPCNCNARHIVAARLALGLEAKP